MECGIDIVSIERIKRLCEGSEFLNKYFSSEEREYFASKKEPYESVAANFAGKEAFSKALGTGVRGFLLQEVAILRDELGKPYFSLSGSALRIAQERGLSFKISLSHEKDYAIAMVLMEEKAL